uniref:Immunoglobulin-binding protein 1 n=1 Tax=Clastoptera arizonana TaxID=38151 RepID=A0A1B6DT47_9HEMI
MASVNQEEKKLSDLYDEAYSLYEEIQQTDQPTNSGIIQHKIQTAIKFLEGVTQRVSIANIFSTNENVEEVATCDLKFFLLPFLLGNLILKLSSKERNNIVQTADIYFRDFIQRCKDYSIVDIDIPEPTESVEINNLAVAKQMNSPSLDLASAAKSRASKIQRYNEQKALLNEIKELKKRLNSASTDDEIRRKYYLTSIKSAVSDSIVELDSLSTEKNLLKYMEKIKKDESLDVNKVKEKIFKPKPLVPVIITRDEIQKKVFGAGYPSLATMSVQDFYDQRVREGIFPSVDAIKMKSLQDMANKENADLIKEREEEEKEMKIENDDEETLATARSLDDYKDTHKRGEGNRYNRS